MASRFAALRLHVSPLEAPWFEVAQILQFEVLRIELPPIVVPRFGAPRIEVLQRVNPLTLWSATP